MNSSNNICRAEDNSQEDDSDVVMDDDEAKKTPIKSWMRNYMNSEKSPEREDSPTLLARTSSNLPQYIIPLVGSSCHLESEI